MRLVDFEAILQHSFRKKTEKTNIQPQAQKCNN